MKARGVHHSCHDSSYKGVLHSNKRYVLGDADDVRDDVAGYDVAVPIQVIREKRQWISVEVHGPFPASDADRFLDGVPDKRSLQAWFVVVQKFQEVGNIDEGVLVHLHEELGLRAPRGRPVQTCQRLVGEVPVRIHKVHIKHIAVS